MKSSRLHHLLLALLLFCASPSDGFGQELLGPSTPYELSPLVQLRAKELKVWETVAADFRLNPAAFPVNFLEGRGWQPLQVYLDQLTAADVVATARARRQGRAAQPDDYDVVFGSWCIFVPNKPSELSASGTLRDITATVRNRLLAGVYLNKLKRDTLEKAMRPVLFRGSKGELFKLLAGITSRADYNAQVLDTNQLR